MKALIVTPRLDTHSGWGRYSLNVVEEYRRRGVCFSVVTRGATQLCPEQFPVLHDLSAINFLRNILTVRKHARSCDVVHAMEGWPYAIYAYGAVLGTRKKLFINAVGTYSLPGHSKLKKRLMSLAYKRAQRILAISRYVAERIEEIFGFGFKTEVVHLGTTLLPELTAAEESFFKTKFAVAGSPVFITVGAIKNRKGQKDSFDALILLKDVYPNFTYLVVGSDEDAGYVEMLETRAEQAGVRENLSIISDAHDDKALSYLYQKSDVVLLNSRNDRHHFEGFGLVFLEGYQFGIPGVGSRGCGIEDAIEDGATGCLAEQKNPKDISDKILKTLEHKKDFGENARDFAKEFSWGKTAERYISLYQKG